jgi:type IV secretion system protein VirB10
MRHFPLAPAFLCAASLFAQSAPIQPPPTTPGTTPAPAPEVTVTPGTHIPLALLNSVSTKHSVAGDRVYMQTVFPIMVDGRLAIPPGSYVLGVVTQIKRPGRVKGRAELYVRFDSLTLPNGTIREFRGRLSAVDGRGDEKLDQKEGAVKGDSNKADDMKTIGEAAITGATVGELASIPSHSYGLGAGVGAAAGAAAGLVAVLVTRGPDAILAQGSTVEMVLDRPLTFQDSELNFGPMSAALAASGPGPTAKGSAQKRSRFPF